jgi:hypothetical protein
MNLTAAEERPFCFVPPGPFEQGQPRTVALDLFGNVGLGDNKRENFPDCEPLTLIRPGQE